MLLKSRLRNSRFVNNLFGVFLKQDYTQVEAPTDPTFGSPVLIEWNATLDDDNPGVGPRAQTNGPFGPRGAAQIEGTVQYARSVTPSNITPLGYVNQLFVKNVAGEAVTLNAGWNFFNGAWYIADGAVVTETITDTNNGGAGFIDQPLYVAVNGGEWDGVTNECDLVSYFSTPGAVGNVHIYRRIGFEGAAFNGVDGATVHQDIIFHAAHEGTDAEEFSIGMWMEGNTVETPWEVELDAVGDTIPVTATTIALNNTSGGTLTLSSTPIIPDGLDGQRVILLNVSANTVALRDESVLAGSNLRLLAGTRNIAQYGSMLLIWSEALSAWVEVGGPPS